MNATVYGLRCGELGDAPGETHDFVLASDYNAAVGRAAQLGATLVRAVQIAQGLHGMIDQETWRASGGDDMQGHYEGDYRAEQIWREIEEWAVLVTGGNA